MDSSQYPRAGIGRSRFIRTKLIPPKSRAKPIFRAHLIERLTNTLNNLPFFTLVSAPAGYGKTTIINAWLNHISLPFAWFTADKGDNDPVRFFGYLLEAFQNLPVGRATESILETQLGSVDLLGSSIVIDLSAITEPFVLVLDDYHVIHNSFVHNVLSFMLENQPPYLNLVVVTREDPPFSLARMRSGNRMTQIGMDELRFTKEEIKHYLNAAFNLAPGDDIVNNFESRTEGWVVGLQLAAMSLKKRGAGNINGFLKDFRGSSRYIFDYFAEEIFKYQSGTIRDFLSKTCVLDRFCPELCKAVGIANSRELLDELLHANLFIYSIDDAQQWYRYHPLFVEFLQARKEKYDYAHIHRKVSLWFEKQGLLMEAVKHAIVSGDKSIVKRLIKIGAACFLQNGRYLNLIEWLNSLSEATIRKDIDLTVYKAWALFLSGRIDEAEKYSVADSILPDDADTRHYGRMLSLRAWIAYTHRQPLEEGMIQRALDLVGDDDPFFKALTLLPLGYAKYCNGATPESVRLFYRAYEMSMRRGNIFTAMCSLHNLAFVLIFSGHRTEAEKLCQEALDFVLNKFGTIPPIAGIVYIPMAASFYHSNRLTRAYEYAIKAVELGRELDIDHLLLETGEIELAATNIALNNLKEAGEIIRRYSIENKRRTASHIANKLDLLEVELDLKQNNQEKAVRWAELKKLNIADNPEVWNELEYMLYARILLVLNHVSDAEVLFRRLADLAQDGQRYGRLIEIKLGYCLAQYWGGREERAVEILSQAVGLASAEDYRRLFLNAGRRIIPLLTKIRKSSPDFVDRLLADFTVEELEGQRVNTTGKGGKDAYGQITRRELELLKLVSAGLTNREIAEKLYISLGTVKWHLNNIYAKLKVKSRTQALVRAAELELY